MKEKDLFKRVTDLDMPDFDKVKNNIIHKERKRVRSFTTKRLAPMFATCCLFLLFVLVVPDLINRKGNITLDDIEDNNSQILQDTSKNIPTNTPITNPPINNPSNDLMANNHIVFNSLDEVSPSDESNIYIDSKIYLDPDKTYKKERTAMEVISYLGVDIRPTKLPVGLKDSTEVYPDSKFTAFYNYDGTTAYEEFTFLYREDFESEEYNPLEKQLKVFVSKKDFVRDYVILFDDEMDKSTISGQELLLGKRKMSYGPYTVIENGPNIPAGYHDIFVAKFIVDGIQVEVVADNFTEDEFVEALTSVIK